jgi:methionine-gamma-lyase
MTWPRSALGGSASRERSRHTLAVHAGEGVTDDLGALSVPIHMASVFAFPDAAIGAEIHDGTRSGFFYGRIGNPTQSALESAMTDLEGGEAALALSSGMAAITCTMLAVLRPGDHVVAPRALYASTYSLFSTFLPDVGISVSFVDGTDPAAYAAAVGAKTKLLYLESPANPTLALTDVSAVVSIARECGLITVMDNTLATPVNQRPLDLGVDVVVHSATKYLGGHADLVAGVIVGDAEVIDRVRWNTNKLLGGVISPLTAWLVLRGIRTLALRMERHNRNAQTVAEFLDGHPKVSDVHYPGLRTHPQHEVARRQMSGFGGVLAFDVRGVDEGRHLADTLRLCSLAVSFGDVATLIQHSATMTHAQVPRPHRLEAGITDGLMRMSVGIEDVTDIIADIERGLEGV